MKAPVALLLLISFVVSLDPARMAFAGEKELREVRQQIKNAEDKIKYDPRNYAPEDASDPNFLYITQGNGSGRIVSLYKKGGPSFVLSSFAKNTRALNVCPLFDGEEVPCIVTFEHDGDDITKIISARRPRFSGVNVNQAGELFQYSGGKPEELHYAKMCNSPIGASDGPPVAGRYFCIYGSSSIWINKVNLKTYIVEVISNCNTYYVGVNDVLVNDHGTAKALGGFVANRPLVENGALAPLGEECNTNAR
jgi:hypothetical protein